MTEGEPEKVPLERLPIEWVQDRVCEETFDNRRALREGGHRWRTVPPDPETGMPSGLIEVPDPRREQETQLAAHADVLADPTDPWSDYVDPRRLPLDAVGVPYWVHRRAEKWEEWAASEGKPAVSGTPGTVAKARKGREPHVPTRCSAVKKDGTRCWAWAMDAAGEGRCRSHAPGAALAANMGHQIALAKIKVMQAMPAMVDELEGLALGAASEQVRLKAVTEMMDRGGVHAGTDVNIAVGEGEGLSPADAIRARLGDLRDRLQEADRRRAELESPPPETVEGEVVEGEAS